MSSHMKTIALAVVLIVGTGAIASAAVTLTGAGATFPQPIYMKWIYNYCHNKYQDAVEINYQGIGSGGGIKAIRSRTVDFGASDAPLTDEEFQSMPAKLLMIPTVGGAVTIAYNVQGLNKRLRFSGSTIAAIFLGEITRWNDPRIARDNPGVNLPDEAVSVAHRSDASGTTWITTHYLASVSPTWREKVGAGKEVRWPVGEGGKGNPGVAALIREIPGCVGYIELAYALENHIPYALVRNRAGRWMNASIETTTACIEGALGRLKKDIRMPISNSSSPRAYPICGLTYLLFYEYQTGDREKAGYLLDYLKYIMSPRAQEMVKTLDYAPLPAALVEMNMAKIRAVRMK